ncbi:MAG: hypothetical protein FJ184_08045 [Gammaproteobacteria bacterium]|nr:hypothetical protein [Gammaproteobacteria bacterium]
MTPTKRILLALALGGCTLGAGCVSIGPRAIELSRGEFNNSIHRTDGEQLLLNIVRQRYNDPVMFLDVASVSSSVSRSASLSLSSFITKNITTGGASTGMGGGISESPLVFYSPNTGEKFVRQILTPIDLRTISLLLQSGWSIERLLLVAGESVNGIRNVAAKTTPYSELADTFRALQRQDALSFAMERIENSDVLTVIVAQNFWRDPAYLRICEILKLRPDGRPIRFRLGIGSQDELGGAYVMLATRSLFSSFYFLSNGISIPQDDLEKRIIQSRQVSGGLFDPSVGDLFHVRVSSSEPAGAAFKTRYRNHWFYISETDADTRTTFALLSIMHMLQSGDTSRMAPLISLSPTR